MLESALFVVVVVVMCIGFIVGIAVMMTESLVTLIHLLHLDDDKKLEYTCNKFTKEPNDG